MNAAKAIKILLTHPLSVIKKGIFALDETVHVKVVLKKYGINQLPTIDILDLFPNLNETINPYSYLTGTSMVTDLLLLKLLAKKIDKCSYLEIGTWRGESIANVSDVAETCTSITLSEKEMKDIGYSDAFTQVHDFFIKKKNNITSIKQNSRTFDFNNIKKKFDLIFIDGEHTYEGVLNDTKKVFALRRNEKSVIVWHDYCFNTEDVRPSVLNGILDGTPKEKHKNLYHISNTMCAIYIENGENYKTFLTKFPSYPNKEFIVSVEGKKL